MLAQTVQLRQRAVVRQIAYVRVIYAPWLRAKTILCIGRRRRNNSDADSSREDFDLGHNIDFLFV